MISQQLILYNSNLPKVHLQPIKQAKFMSFRKEVQNNTINTIKTSKITTKMKNWTREDKPK